MNNETKYTQTVKSPHYIPSGKIVSISELGDSKKYREILNRIDKSDVSDLEKAFLRIAATRHIVFNYSKIADYYANASKEMQELMEDSALVIIDFDDAIEKGYAKLNKNISNILNDKVGELDA